MTGLKIGGCKRGVIDSERERERRRAGDKEEGGKIVREIKIGRKEREKERE